MQAYAHPDNCDQFFLCTNGTLTLETCENGLLFDGKGNVHNHCNYNWAVDCETRKFDRKFCHVIEFYWVYWSWSWWFSFFKYVATPISTPGCEYAFGIYPDSPECSTSYLKCAHGEPSQHHCDDGLAYDERIHGCNWPDQLLHICNPEGEFLSSFLALQILIYCHIEIGSISFRLRFSCCWL